MAVLHYNIEIEYVLDHITQQDLEFLYTPCTYLVDDVDHRHPYPDGSRSKLGKDG